MAKYLVETDWAVHYLRGNRRVVRSLQSLQPDGLALSILSVAELEAGVFRSTAPAAAREGLEDFLTVVEILPLDRDTCRLFGEYDARLRAEGTPLDLTDLLIACTALRHGLIVLTDNRKHFLRVGGLSVGPQD